MCVFLSSSSFFGFLFFFLLFLSRHPLFSFIHSLHAYTHTTCSDPFLPSALLFLLCLPLLRSFFILPFVLISNRFYSCPPSPSLSLGRLPIFTHAQQQSRLKIVVAALITMIATISLTSSYLHYFSSFFLFLLTTLCYCCFVSELSFFFFLSFFSFSSFLSRTCACISLQDHSSHSLRGPEQSIVIRPPPRRRRREGGEESVEAEHQRDY